MELRQTFDKDFEQLLARTDERFLAVEGIDGDGLDMARITERFFSTAHDLSAVDQNSNVEARDAVTFAKEGLKPFFKLQSLHELWKEIKAERGLDKANEIIGDCLEGAMYINDVTGADRPYCYAYSTLYILQNGLLFSNSKLKILPAKSLHSFLRQIEQFVAYASNATLGAVGLPDLLITCAILVDRIKATGKDGHIHVGDYETYCYEHLTSLIYTLNWTFRGAESPFTAISLYDSYFLNKMVPNYAGVGIAHPKIETVQELQRIFMRAYTDTLRRTPITFPVVTGNLFAQVVDGKRKVMDEAFLDWLAEVNLPYASINIYAGDTETACNCCRLRASVADLGFSNTLGTGTVQIGSVGVVTLNLPWIFERASEIKRLDEAGMDTRLEGYDPKMSHFDLFFALIRHYAYEAGVINHAKRQFIKRREAIGALPLYTHGYMSHEFQYSTIGFNGMHEAAKKLLVCTFEDLVDAEKRMLDAINEVCDALNAEYEEPHNCEQTPSESSAVKLAQKTRIRFPWAKDEPPLYSNQFIPLLEDVDIADRIMVQGALDASCSGGAIMHLNVGNRIEDKGTMKELIRSAIEAGVVLHAVNYRLGRCEDNHMTVLNEGASDACTVCGKPIVDKYTRVVGFLTNVRNWNRVRQTEDFPNRVFK